MKNNRKLYAGLFLVLVGILGLAFMKGIGSVPGRMGRSHMMEWMQHNFADLLPPGIDPSLLPEPDSQGARLLQHYCSQCHALPSPALHVSAEWPAVVVRMQRRMRMMSHHRMMMRGRVSVPSQAELQSILAYLQRYAQQPMDVASYEQALKTPEGRAFVSVCSRCHALPSPRQHSAAEWPGVIQRMKDHMLASGQRLPEERTFHQISGFMQRYSRD